jgi:TetR/AcrR family fatty acid metabolism transcriptional regulator
MSTPPTSTRSSLKEKQRREREDLILQTAEEVLTEKGYHDTSMDEIALRVGIAKGTLYLHFASKEELVMALIERSMPLFLQGIEQIAASALGPRAKLEAILQMMVKGTLGKKRFEFFTALSQSAELRKLFEEHELRFRKLGLWERLVTEITTLIEAGKTTGEFDASLPTDVMVSAFLSVLSPVVHQRLLKDKQMPAEELAEYLGCIYFRGITTH